MYCYYFWPTLVLRRGLGVPPSLPRRWMPPRITHGCPLYHTPYDPDPHSAIIQFTTLHHNDCFHTRAKYVVWMIIRIAQFEHHSNDGILDRVYAIYTAMHKLNCAIQMTVQRCFQWCISQITQRNCRMNALTSKLWLGGLSYMTFSPLPPIYCVLHMCSTGNASSGMLSRKFGLLCVHCVIQISQFSCVYTA